ncbi:MAG: LysR family transcriptional regulator [Pseudomonadota bacterium]
METQVGNLVAFAYLVRTGSVSDAAGQLGVSQSAVSQRLQKLEGSVGSKLFVRERGGIVLTAVGRDLIEIANQQAELLQIVNEKIGGYASADEGALTLIANAPLPALGLIGRFSRARPKVKINFTLYDWTTSVELLRDRKVDIAVMTDLTSSAQWTAKTIGTTRYGVYLKAGHRLSGKASVSLADLADETLLLPEPGSLTERIVRRALADAAVTPVRIMQLTTFPLVIEAIKQNVGVGIFLQNASSPADDIVWRPVDELCHEYDVSLAIPRGKEELGLVRAFKECVEES